MCGGVNDRSQVTGDDLELTTLLLGVQASSTTPTNSLLWTVKVFLAFSMVYTSLQIFLLKNISSHLKWLGLLKPQPACLFEFHCCFSF